MKKFTSLIYLFCFLILFNSSLLRSHNIFNRKCITNCNSIQKNKKEFLIQSNNKELNPKNYKNSCLEKSLCRG